MGVFSNLFSPPAKNKVKKELVVLVGLADFQVEVLAGRNGQAALEAICGRRIPTGVRRYETARLVQDNQNPHDKQRVRVLIRGRQVGILPPRMAVQYRSYLASQGTPDADGQCQALIQGGWLSAGGRKGDYLVSLDFPIYGPGESFFRRFSDPVE
jgi:hypothetical protein